LSRFGDLAPVTEEGKLAAALYALVAVNVVGTWSPRAREDLPFAPRRIWLGTGEEGEERLSEAW